MSSITLTVDIQALENAEVLHNVLNVISSFDKAVLSIEVMKRGVNPIRINFEKGEYVDHITFTKGDDLDKVFDLLGLPVQLIEGYREIKVNTSYREHLVLPASREYVDVALSERSLPVYVTLPVIEPITNTRGFDPNNLTEPANRLVLVGHTSGELTVDTDSLRMWVKPDGSAPYSEWNNKQGNVWLFMSHELVEVTGILLT